MKLLFDENLSPKLRLLADEHRLLRQHLDVVEPAIHESEARLRRPDGPVVIRLPQLVGERAPSSR